MIEIESNAPLIGTEIEVEIWESKRDYQKFYYDVNAERLKRRSIENRRFHIERDPLKFRRYQLQKL
jgi:hypothetical protein